MVNSAFNRHAADKIVAESNFGGEMVRATLEADQLYEKDLVRHVGYFPEIEEQLMDFTVAGYQGMRSPDRADALVWAVTELFPSIAQKQDDKIWTPPKVITRKRSASQYDVRRRRAIH